MIYLFFPIFSTYCSLFLYYLIRRLLYFLVSLHAPAKVSQNVSSLLTPLWSNLYYIHAVFRLLISFIILFSYFSSFLQFFISAYFNLPSHLKISFFAFHEELSFLKCHKHKVFHEERTSK